MDIVLESQGGDVCGIEVKLSSTLNRRDFRGLEHLQERLGKRFRAGARTS